MQGSSNYQVTLIMPLPELRGRSNSALPVRAPAPAGRCSAAHVLLRKRHSSVCAMIPSGFRSQKEGINRTKLGN